VKKLAALAIDFRRVTWLIRIASPSLIRPMQTTDAKLIRTDLVVTYIGGPTALLKWDGLRILTDPTFDPAGSTYPLNLYTLKKRDGPACVGG